MIKFLKNLTVNFLFTLLPLFIFTGFADLISEFSVFSLAIEEIFGGFFMNSILMLPTVYFIRYIIKSIRLGFVLAPSSSSSGSQASRGPKYPKRNKEPVSFWICIGIWCFFPLSLLGFYLWFVFLFIQDLLK